jgi:cytidylate kinase
MQDPKSGGHYEAAHLVERQMLFREARERIVQEALRGAQSSRYRFVTVSRQPGSLGADIVRELGGLLCWHVYDREILESIALSANVRHRLVEQLDEKAQNLVHETVQRFLRMAEGGSFGIEEYHESLLRTLAGLAARGEAILVGRGANFVLHGQENGLHVRIIASEEARVDRLCRRWNVPAAEALRRMRETDLVRSGFIRSHFKHDIGDPRFYDLVLNTDHLAPRQAVGIIIGAMLAERA